jgi:hypothetical protein
MRAVGQKERGRHLTYAQSLDIRRAHPVHEGDAIVADHSHDQAILEQTKTRLAIQEGEVAGDRRIGWLLRVHNQVQPGA